MAKEAAAAMVMGPELQNDLGLLVKAAVSVVVEEHARCVHSLAVAPELRKRCEEKRGRDDAWRCIARHEVLMLEASLDRLAVGAVGAELFERQQQAEEGRADDRS